MIIDNRYEIIHKPTTLFPHAGMWCAREFEPATDTTPEREIRKKYDTRFHRVLSVIVEWDLASTHRNAPEFIARMRELADEIEAGVMPSEEEK